MRLRPCGAGLAFTTSSCASSGTPEPRRCPSTTQIAPPASTCSASALPPAQGRTGVAASQLADMSPAHSYKPVGGDSGAAGGGSDAERLPDQIKSESCPQPVPLAQLPSSSSVVQSRAPAAEQMASASVKFFSWWQPPISAASDSVQTEQPPQRRHVLPSFVSEQQRTSCSSDGTAQRADSEQRPARPHVANRSGVAAPGGGGGGCGGGGADGEVGGGGASDGNRTSLSPRS